MRRLNLILAFVLVTALALTAAHIISAQQRGGMQQGQGRQQRQFDPEQMFERRLDRIKQNIKEMGLSAEEVDYLGTQIGNFLREGMNQRNAMQTLIEDLQKAMDAKNEAEMKTKLSEIKAKRKEHEKKLEEMEAKLIELLPVELEARLTIDGIINSGGGFGMMRIGGPRGQGGMPGAGGQRMQRGSGG